MSIRDLGMIELTVFAALFALFVLFFGLFVMLRHQKRVAKSRKLLKKRALMEEAVRQKVRPARGKVRHGMATEWDGVGRICPDLREESTVSYPERGEIRGKMENKSEESAMSCPEKEEIMENAEMEPEGYVVSRPEKGKIREGAAMEREESRMTASPGQEGIARKVVVKKREEMRDATRRRAYVEFSGRPLSEEYGEEIAKSPGSGQWDIPKKEEARLQKDGSFFVEQRRISHRRDQLKRLEEAK